MVIVMVMVMDIVKPKQTSKQQQKQIRKKGFLFFPALIVVFLPNQFLKIVNGLNPGVSVVRIV